MTPHQRKRLRTLKGKSSVKSKDSPPETPSYSETRENPSPIPPPSEDTDNEPSSEHSEVISLPSSPRSPTSPDLTTPRSLSPDRTISSIPTMGTVKDLVEALREMLKDIGRHPTIPLSQFRGKKGEDPNDHCMKVEDNFAMFDIESDENQKKRFLETLFQKARRWASTINIDELDGYKYDDKSTTEQKGKSFKWQFLKRFAKEGRTTHVAFEAWRNLKFDPVKDEVEEFMTNVKNLAATLEFNEEAQIMDIKCNMPRDVYDLSMQYNKLDELKKFLTEHFESPKMKSAVPSITAAVETSAFSMGEFFNNDVVSATSEDIGKLKNEISTLQYKVRRMTCTDTRSKPNSKLGNLKLPLPEEEEVILEVKEVDKMMLVDKLVIVLAQMTIVVMVGISMVGISQEIVTAVIDHLAIGVRTMVTLVEIKGIEVEVGLTPVQMSEDLE